ncbi:MAG TPA: hypothetical protein VFY71_15295 [Planctomycetota bacterium]|nr:hypothetical protein [Planctomycetota bacterium]
MDTAQDGDLIRVMPGNYGKVNIQHKLVSLLGTGASATTVDSLRVAGAAAGFVSVSALSITHNTGFSSNQATIVLRDCVGRDLLISGCHSVFVENWHGRRGTSDAVDALWLTSSEFVGPQGKDAVWSGPAGGWSQLPTPGMAGFGARHSVLYVDLGSFSGGAGGKGSCVQAQGYLDGAPGGAGLEDETGDCALWIAKSTFHPGAGGKGGSTCARKAGASDVQTQPGTVLKWDQQGADLFPLSILAPSVIGSHTTIEVWGHPGDGVMLMIATHPASVLDGSAAGFPLGVDLSLGVVNLWPLTRKVGSNGYLLWEHKIPNEPLLVGTATFVQALLIAPASAPYHPPMNTGVSTSIISD